MYWGIFGLHIAWFSGLNLISIIIRMQCSFFFQFQRFFIRSPKGELHADNRGMIAFKRHKLKYEIEIKSQSKHESINTKINLFSNCFYAPRICDSGAYSFCPVCLSVRLSVCLFVCLSVRLWSKTLTLLITLLLFDIGSSYFQHVFLMIRASSWYYF